MSMHGSFARSLLPNEYGTRGARASYDRPAFSSGFSPSVRVGTVCERPMPDRGSRVSRVSSVPPAVPRANGLTKRLTK